ncbi:MAG: PKD domain-containing protein [Thermoplasmatales archaeon]|nr:MAG: PKD domain-containing protein [Thermoplasmatales archaeon]
MKKRIICVLVSALLIISVLPIVLTAGEQPYIKEKIESIVFSEPNIQDGDQYMTLSVKEAPSRLMEPGKPMLPVYTKIFKFPFGTKIEGVICKPSHIYQKVITGEIQPSPIPVPTGPLNDSVKKRVFATSAAKDNSVYNSKDFFPYSWYDYRLGCGLDGSRRVVFLTVRFYPVQYSPGQKMIQYTKNANIEVKYSEPIQPAVFTDEYDMVIITPSEFSDKLQPLVEYKNDSGRATILVTLNDIYDGNYFPVKGRDDQEKIKYFIKNAIKGWNITYVLLAGGENKVPVRMSHVRDGHDDSIISDLYYADIYEYGSFCSWDSNGNGIFGEYYDGEVDQVDLHPDVKLGRLNFKDKDEVSTVVNKIITYESTGAYMEEWFSNFVVCGGDTFPDGGNVPEGEYLNEHAITIMDDFIPNKIWATNKKVKWPENIDKAIEDGSGFVYMTGHGTHNCWTTHPLLNFNTWWPLGTYLNLYVMNLKNGDELPVVIIGGCSNLKFSENICFGWSFLKNPDGGGIASYGNSADGWGYVGTMCTQGLTGGMELSAFKAYGNQNAKTTGELWTKALNNYLKEFGVSSAYGYKTVEEWLSFSDPSLRIAKVSEKPNKPDRPEGPTSGAVQKEYTYTTSTTDPDGDLIKYCFDWGDETFTWTDWLESGENVSVSHIWEEPGNYEIKVKARDKYGLDSEWSESLALHIGGPILEIQAIRGGLFKLSVLIKNVGDADTTGVNWSISVKGGIVGFINVSSKGTIEALAVGDEETISCKKVFGFGKVDIAMEASSSSSNKLSVQVNGLVLGFLVIVLA